ncbi:restriction endonuclease [Sinanaerobacter chloroacetimidivorans]|uniref:Restriction endonuclease n=1 Tax=Sinanaerobacter chloroacetimidivorans TaxID=2818044 RepID=A0A8J8B4X5_9FIRM|nr:restriction endonuclease [Sinanaerobacter chloroacetimidivorans]MBR0599785.1 restriction endonuclease [Sinanaerobacter chloroacetimidivorans]
MARRGYGSILTAMAREAARQQRVAEADQKRRIREAERARREEIRQAALDAKEEKQRYLEIRVDEVDEMNEELEERVSDLLSILTNTLSINDTISFNSLKIHDAGPKYKPPVELATLNNEPTLEYFIQNVKSPGFFDKLVPGWQNRYENAKKQAEDNYRQEKERYEVAENERKDKLEKYKARYEKEKSDWDLKVQQRNKEVDDFEQSYKNKDIASVISYNSMVLERSQYPDEFPQNFRVTYAEDSKELVIEYQLPTVEIIPAVQEYKYVKSRDAIDEKQRKQTEIKEIYQDVIAAICLRSIHEVFEADQGNVIDLVVFNGYVETVDPATGKDIKPFLISIRVTKERFLEIDLKRAEKKACLRNLGAQISPRPDELQPVKPIIEFDMVDKRFVEQQDVLSALDNRPNLMDLNPFEFENLVANLFGKMGLETKQTRSSKDGGVDAVAFDNRPVLGGKVVIQAKRYKNLVGVSAVRDLYGTMMNEGANKGILVTTSSYGPDAYDFSKDKPIELIDGGALLYLLDQVGVQARIIFPEDKK